MCQARLLRNCVLYGSKQPLQVAGTFTADVLVGNSVK